MVSAPRPLASAPRRRVAALLGNRTGVLREAVSAMVMSGCALTPLLLPLRVTARRNRSAWMQYCSLCLADDASPYFRRQRRLASRISCFVHGRGCVIVVPPAAVRSPPLIRTNLSLSISAPNAGSTCAWRRKLSSSLSAAARKMHRRYLQVGADHRFEDGRRFGFTPVARTGPGRQHFGEKPHKPRRRASAALSS
nr:TniQ family protein [Mesorhizobium sp.]